jgi:hypothetical protein
MNLFTLAVLATLINPTVTFTEDSVYTKDNILTVEYVEEYDGTHTLKLTENNIVGYSIYDDEETPYIDGVMLDGVPITAWTMHQFDTTVEHTITVKTVYSEDIFGALISAKNGDWTLIWQSPLTYIQLFYYALNTIAIVFEAFGIRKYKKEVNKLKGDLSTSIKNYSTEGNTAIVKLVDSIVEGIVSELYGKLSKQYQDIIKALVLSHSNTHEDTLALMDILNRTSNEDISEFVNNIKQKYTALIEHEKIVKEKAIEMLEKISESESMPIDDGTSI